MLARRSLTFSVETVARFDFIVVGSSGGVPEGDKAENLFYTFERVEVRNKGSLRKADLDKINCGTGSRLK